MGGTACPERRRAGSERPAAVGAEPPPVARPPGTAPGRDPLGNQRAPPGDFSARSVTRIQGRTEFFLLPAFVLVRSFSLSTFIAPPRVVPGARPQHFARLRWDFGRCRPSYSRSCCSRRGTRRDGCKWALGLLSAYGFLPASPPLNFVSEALTLFAFATLGARGGRRAALLSPPPVRSLVLPGAAGRSPAGRAFFRAGVPWGSPERSPRSTAPLLTRAPLPGGSSRMGNISCGSGGNSRT